MKKGTQLIVPIWSANRCRETYGEDAEEFRPERWVERDGEGEKVVKGGNGLYNLQTFIQGCAVSSLTLLSIADCRSHSQTTLLHRLQGALPLFSSPPFLPPLSLFPSS